ncbi:MAG: PASTA domain-containing protein, partial [Clostridia bacterium]|nr:PASTA domain-containing protein [Clostridia bacterium]
LFEYYNIPPEAPEMIEKGEKELEMPNLVGLTLTKAIEELQKLGVAYEIVGDGGKIKSQFPYAGIKIYTTDTVQITLG